MIETIYNWTAKRSGAAITIEGVDANGEARLIAGVATIAVIADGRVHATMADADKPDAILVPFPLMLAEPAADAASDGGGA